VSKVDMGPDLGLPTGWSDLWTVGSEYAIRWEVGILGQARSALPTSRHHEEGINTRFPFPLGSLSSWGLLEIAN
jgi:hypothetical protein